MLLALIQPLRRELGSLLFREYMKAKDNLSLLHGEEKKDIPLQVVLAFEVKRVAAVEVYKHVDAHMTDSSK